MISIKAIKAVYCSQLLSMINRKWDKLFFSFIFHRFCCRCCFVQFFQSILISFQIPALLFYVKCLPVIEPKEMNWILSAMVDNISRSNKLTKSAFTLCVNTLYWTTKKSIIFSAKLQFVHQHIWVPWIARQRLKNSRFSYIFFT